MTRCGSASDEDEGVPVPAAQGRRRRRRTGGSRRSRRRSGRARSRSGATAAAPSSSRTATPPTSGCSTSSDPRPQRLTTGREPMPYWEDTAPRLSPDGARVAYAEEGGRLARARRRRPAARAARGRLAGLARRRDARGLRRARPTRPGSPSIAVDRPVAAPARPRAASDHGDEWGAAVSPDRRTRSPTSSRRAPTSTARRSASPTSRPARSARSPARRGMQDRAPAWSPDGATIAYVLGALGQLGAPRRRPATASGERQLTTDAADYGEPAWHPDGDRIARDPRRRERVRPRDVDAASGAVTRARARRHLGRAALDRRRRRRSPTYEDHATPPELRLLQPGGRRARCSPPRPLAVRARPARRPRGRHVRLARRPRDPRLPVPPAGTRPAPGPRDRLPARRPHRRATCDDWDGHAQYFLDKGYAWLRVNFRGSTGYGRDFERAQPRRLGRRGHLGLPRRRRPPAHARLGRRRPAGDLRRLLRLLHVAARRHRRPRAPLPLRRRQVRRLRHPDLVGAGRPRGRPGPGADDGPPVDGPRRLPRRLAGITGSRDRGAAADRPRRARRAS